MSDYSNWSNTELDILIAEQVMGWERRTYQGEGNYFTYWHVPGEDTIDDMNHRFEPSTEYEDTLEMLLFVLEDGLAVGIKREQEGYGVVVGQIKKDSADGAAITPSFSRTLCEAVAMAYKVK